MPLLQGQGAAPARPARQHLPVPGRARQARRPGGEELVAQPGPAPSLVELQPLALQIPLALRGEEGPQPQPLAVAQENRGPVSAGAGLAAGPAGAAGPPRSSQAGPRRDKDGEGRARHAEAEAARARRRSRSYSPIRKRRRDSPSFMEPRRITRYGGAGAGPRGPWGSSTNRTWCGEGRAPKERR